MWFPIRVVPYRFVIRLCIISFAQSVCHAISELHNPYGYKNVCRRSMGENFNYVTATPDRSKDMIVATINGPKFS